MNTYYTAEQNVQMLVALMKAHGIKKVIASPGTTNISFVASIQQDPYFEVYSSVDERSAAYLACGLASESGEAVALSCTGATASRNYLSGLTEAYYRKLPILAITSTQHSGNIGQNVPQVIDRTTILNDVAKISVQIPSINSEDDKWTCNVMLNRALLELYRHGGGPVHINIATTYCSDFSVKELPQTRVIERICYNNVMPELKGTRVGIFVGAHKSWSEELEAAVEKFCEKYNGVVLCDHTSNYFGKYRVYPSLVTSQLQYNSSCKICDVLIHIGDISGSPISVEAKEVWRVNPDGEIRDTFRKLRYVFEMDELTFFTLYAELKNNTYHCTYYEEWERECEELSSRIQELPFSNAWIAQHMANKIPRGSVIHFGILNSLRSWNFQRITDGVSCFCNTGGFGIDGGVSSLVGASLANPDVLYFGFFGDLAFFYDMNVLGNRHINRNIHILVVNNGRGQEFKNYNHPASRFGDDADKFMAAGGHFGRQSQDLIRHYSEDLGFEYLSAFTKQEFIENIDKFTSEKIGAQPILFEVFTNTKDESDALNILCNLESSVVGAAKVAAKKVLGDKGVKKLKNFLNK